MQCDRLNNFFLTQFTAFSVKTLSGHRVRIFNLKKIMKKFLLSSNHNNNSTIYEKALPLVSADKLNVLGICNLFADISESEVYKCF